MDLSERLNVAHRALATLEEVVGKSASDKVMRDAAIQRFEYTVEATWKAAQRYLEEREGLRAGSPKAVARACQEAGVLSVEEAEAALAMIDDRNLTVHTYNEKLAQAMYGRLPRYVALLRGWLDRMHGANRKP